MIWNKRTASVALAGLLLCTTPAAWATDITQSVSKNVNAASVQQGVLGDAISWDLDEEGTLWINGGGSMPDFDSSASLPPWAAYNSSINAIIIEGPITNLGNAAFAGCGAETVTIPSHITMLGEGTFQDCKNLKSFVFPDDVSSLGHNLFSGCTSLTSVLLPENVTSIGSGAFASCTSLRELAFSGNVPDFAADTFTGTTLEIHYPAKNTTWTPDVMQDYGGSITWIADGAHIHTYGTPVFTWAEDNTCKAAFTCTDADDTQSVNCSITHKATDATCTQAGETVYTATVQFDGNTYMDTMTVEIPATGHIWGEGILTKAPTTTEEGIQTYTCTVCMQTKTEPVSKLASETPPAPPSPEKIPVCEIFSDISETSWYTSAVQYVYDNNIMTGMGNGTFAPNIPMTRAMVAQIIYSIEDSPAVSGKMPFSDVDKKWYYDAILWASQNNIVAGMGNGTFRPNDVITREQYARILYNYEQEPVVSGSLDFPDAEAVSSWAKDSMLWANQNGIISGTKKKDGIVLDPKGTATRAQSAMVLMNYLTKEN
ncbi:MAG: S-layer homology domain-containing protein [Eubacteriales bacterium]|nr:S-layer homology domain-containing protein [Eubacteriales bacterium]